MALLSEKSRSDIVEWTAALVCFYYPTTAVMMNLSGVFSTPVNIAIRLLFLIIFITNLVLAFIFTKPKFGNGILWVIAFWLIYSIRLISDVSIRGIPMETKSPFLIYTMAYGSTFLPMLSLAVNRKYLALSTFTSKSLILITIGNFAILYYIIASPQGIQELLTSRLDLRSDNEDSVLNPITISVFGELLALLSLNKLINFKNTSLHKFIYVLLFSICLGNLIL